VNKEAALKNRPCRRRFLASMGGIALSSTACQQPGPDPLPAPGVSKDRALGAFLGAAIADAIGGPVECQHAARIRKHYGEITGLLPYRKPPGLIELKPGYALYGDPGAVTDDTFIRVDVTRFYLETEPPRTTAQFAEWLLANADFRMWWKPAVEALERIQRGEVSAEEGGLSHRQGGGGAWWTPVGIIHAGDPAGAAAEVEKMCRPWKAPLEQDIIGAVHAGTAESLREGATVDSVVDTVLEFSGPLARQLFTRAAEIGRAAGNSDELIEQLYRHCLVNDCRTETDGPLPQPAEAVDYAEGFYTSTLFAEQQPLALAAFVYARGEPRRAILQAVQNGRDADSIASNVGGWAGGLHGLAALPPEWVEPVRSVNMREFDLYSLGEQLLEVETG
jgi:ADP-ribosylglycohydrolase